MSYCMWQISYFYGCQKRLTKSMCPSTVAETNFMCRVPYGEVVGALLWCSLVCRLDLSYAVTQVSKFNSNPVVAAVQRILLYACRSRELGILFVVPKDNNLI